MQNLRSATRGRQRRGDEGESRTPQSSWLKVVSLPPLLRTASILRVLLGDLLLDLRAESQFAGGLRVTIAQNLV